MKFLSIFLIAFLIVTEFIFAQQPNSNELNYNTWYLRSQGIPLNASMGLTLGVYEFQYSETRILEVPLLMRVDITEDVSLLGGGTFDFYQTPQGFSKEFDTSATFGIQYEMNDDAYIQGLINFPVLNSNNPYNYKIDSPFSFSIRSGFKF